MNNIDKLVCTGGGSKVISCIGALKILEEKNILKNIKKYAGSSAGGIICTLLNLEYSSKEIIEIILKINFGLINNFFLRIPFNLMNNYGLFNGNKIVKLFENLLEKKGFNKNTTFLELYIKTGKILVLTGVSITVQDVFYFNFETTPNMKIVDALRITMSIPLFFTSIKYKINEKEHIFVDGGLINNFPIYYFDIVDEYNHYFINNEDLSKKKKEFGIKMITDSTIGILCLDEEESLDVDDYYQGTNKINNIVDFIRCTLNTMLNKIEEDNFYNPITGSKKDFFKNVITIKLPIKIKATDVNLKKNDIDKLIEAGEEAAKKFFK